MKTFLCKLLITFSVALFFASCKTSPAPSSAALKFISIEAHDTAKMNLNYEVSVRNPDSKAALNPDDFSVAGWSAAVNETEVKNGISLAALPGEKTMSLRIEIDVPALIAEGVPVRDDFTVDLMLDLLCNSTSNSTGKKSAPPVLIQARETAVFPYIREPVFSITEIAILKADLVNTRFRVTITIDNPNNFPVELSSLEYELYGNKLLWAEGRERNSITVPEKSSYQGNHFLTMNFINMKRDLLDQIIRLDDVNYRFSGKAFVGTGVEYLPRFSTEFNLSGYSKVLDASK